MLAGPMVHPPVVPSLLLIPAAIIDAECNDTELHYPGPQSKQPPKILPNSSDGSSTANFQSLLSNVQSFRHGPPLPHSNDATTSKLREVTRNAE